MQSPHRRGRNLGLNDQHGETCTANWQLEEPTEHLGVSSQSTWAYHDLSGPTQTLRISVEANLFGSAC